MKYSLLAVLAAAFAILAPACAADEAEEAEATDGASEALRASGYGATTLKYEGTCNFLRTCSSYSKGLPAGKVVWGCSQYNDDVDGDGADEYGSCSDTSLWVAGPTRAYCGKTVHICKGSTCVDAVVKDVSVSKSWEASNGVMDSLNMDYGLSGRCSGFGGGKVTISKR